MLYKPYCARDRLCSDDNTQHFEQSKVIMKPRNKKIKMGRGREWQEGKGFSEIRPRRKISSIPRNHPSNSDQIR